MTSKTRLGINLLAVVALGAIMVTWVVTQVVGPCVVDRPFAVSADFAASGGLFSEQEVTYGGVLVGRVGDMSLNDDGVAIEMLIDPEWEGRIPADVVAKINSKSPVGEQYINLVPKRGASRDLLAADDVIKRADTRLSVDVQDLFAPLEGVLGDAGPGETRRLIETSRARWEARKLLGPLGSPEGRDFYRIRVGLPHSRPGAGETSMNSSTPTDCRCPRTASSGPSTAS